MSTRDGDGSRSTPLEERVVRLGSPDPAAAAALTRASAQRASVPFPFEHVLLDADDNHQESDAGQERCQSEHRKQLRAQRAFTVCSSPTLNAKRTMPPSFVTGSRLLARVCWAIDIMEASLVRLSTTVSRSRRISRRAPLAPGRCPSPPRPRMIPTSCSDCRELRRVSAVSTHASGGAFGGTSTPPLSYLLLRTVSPFELLDASLALDSVPRHGRGHVVLVSPLSICLAPQADVGLISSSPLINVKTSEIGRHRSDSRRPWLPS
jgi:hypothetical protein